MVLAHRGDTKGCELSPDGDSSQGLMGASRGQGHEADLPGMDRVCVPSLDRLWLP